MFSLSCSQSLFKKNFQKIFQVFFSNLCEISQDSLSQNNRERLLLDFEWCDGKKFSTNDHVIIKVTYKLGKTVSVCDFTKTL